MPSTPSRSSCRECKGTEAQVSNGICSWSFAVQALSAGCAQPSLNKRLKAGREKAGNRTQTKMRRHALLFTIHLRSP